MLPYPLRLIRGNKWWQSIGAGDPLPRSFFPLRQQEEQAVERPMTLQTLLLKDLKVCCCSTDEAERVKTHEMLAMRKLDVLVLSEKKLKG